MFNLGRQPASARKAHRSARTAAPTGGGRGRGHLLNPNNPLREPFRPPPPRLRRIPPLQRCGAGIEPGVHNKDGAAHRRRRRRRRRRRWGGGGPSFSPWHLGQMQHRRPGSAERICQSRWTRGWSFSSVVLRGPHVGRRALGIRKGLELF